MLQTKRSFLKDTFSLKVEIFTLIVASCAICQSILLLLCNKNLLLVVSSPTVFFGVVRNVVSLINKILFFFCDTCFPQPPYRIFDCYSLKSLINGFIYIRSRCIVTRALTQSEMPSSITTLNSSHDTVQFFTVMFTLLPFSPQNNYFKCLRSMTFQDLSTM